MTVFVFKQSLPLPEKYSINIIFLMKNMFSIANTQKFLRKISPWTVTVLYVWLRICCKSRDTRVFFSSQTRKNIASAVAWNMWSEIYRCFLLSRGGVVRECMMVEEGASTISRTMHANVTRCWYMADFCIN